MSNVTIFSLVIIAGVFIAACSQILLKKAALKKYDSVLAEYLNWRVILAYGLFGCSAIMTMLSLRFVPLSLVPVLESAGYIFVAILSLIFLKEKLQKLQLLGIGLILLGIFIFNI